jgi:hypothetical protein
MTTSNANTFTSPPHSVSVQGAYEPFDLQVARNQIMGHSVQNIYGYQGSVTTTNIPLWENAAAYVYPVSATSMNLASNNAGDTATILINGLNASFAPVTESVVLNGTTPVATTNSFIRINSMQVSVGSATNPAGVVTLKDPTNTTTYAQINAGIGRTQMSIFTVPAGYTFYLSRVDCNSSFNGNNANYVTYKNYNVSSTGVVTVTQQSPFTAWYHSQRVMPRAFAEKTDLQFQFQTSAGTAAVNCSVEGWLIKNNSQAA